MKNLKKHITLLLLIFIGTQSNASTKEFMKEGLAIRLSENLDVQAYIKNNLIIFGNVSIANDLENGIIDLKSQAINSYTDENIKILTTKKDFYMATAESFLAKNIELNIKINKEFPEFYNLIASDKAEVWKLLQQTTIVATTAKSFFTKLGLQAGSFLSCIGVPVAGVGLYVFYTCWTAANVGLVLTAIPLGPSGVISIPYISIQGLGFSTATCASLATLSSKVLIGAGIISNCVTNFDFSKCFG